MKLNIPNKKRIIVLALVFFMIAPMLMTMNPAHADGAATGTFSVVQQGTGGTTNINSVTLPSSPNPIGTTIKFDVYISGAANIWGWTIGTVSWNPAVLKITKCQEGPWLANNQPSGDPTSFVGSSSSLWDNIGGQINGGISEAISGADQSVDPAGVVATITFQVIGYGSSQIHISGGNLRVTSSDHTGVSAPCNSASVLVQQPVASIGLFAHGTTSSNIEYPSLSNPMNAIFQVDMNISGAVGVWGWNAGVTWNPSVVQLQNITEGSYLRQTGATLFGPGYIDNYWGKIQAGISDAYMSYMNSSATSGCLAILTFKIVSYASGCNINVTAGSPSTLLNQNVPHQPITPVNLNNATYSWTPAPAQGPQAVITTSGSPFGANQAKTYPNYALTLDGSQSVAGTDMIPPYENCPITTYAWSITLVNGTILTLANQESVALTADQIGAQPGNIVATLTVTAPDPDQMPAPTYTYTNSTTLTIQIIQSGPATGPVGYLDTWTQYGGYGWNQSSSAFGPQQQVNVYSYVTYDGAPVVGKAVSYYIYLNGSVIDYRTVQTDYQGYATFSYRLPWQDSNPTSAFGLVNITSAMTLSEVTLNDSVTFNYGYLVTMGNVHLTNGPAYNRDDVSNNTVSVSVDVSSINWNSTNFWIAATIYDSNGVPVATMPLVEGLTQSGQMGSWTSSVTQTVTFSLTIPTWAFVGGATVYINIYNNDPTQLGLPFSPEQSTTLYIAAGTR